MEYLLGVFMDLHCARPAGGMSVGAILLSEIDAWQRVFQITLSPWEVETILHLDRAALSEMMDTK